eukprot:SAG22_NODE_95_length_20791_cov_40.318514_11_plen_75_part_00
MEALSALRRGSFLVVVSPDPSAVLGSEAHKQLTDRDTGLGFPPTVIYDPDTTVTSLQAPISAFLDEERLDEAYK